METVSLLIFSLLLGGGIGNDLLSLVPTDAYWKSKEVEVTAANIMLDLNSVKSDDTSKATAIRRLMAIRTLGELKSPDAMSTLKSQLDSKEMFVADYAQRAIDAIEGKAGKGNVGKASGVPPDRMKADLYMLPEHCGAVGQARLFSGPPLSFPKPKDGEEAAGGDEQSQREQMANMMIYVAEMTGNIRVDGVTLGVSDEVGPMQGFVCLLVRGQWDADAVKSALQPEFNQTKTVDDVDFLSPQFGGAAAAIPSNELFCFTAGDNPGTLPLDDLAAAIKTGKGKLDSAEDLVKLIGTVDTTQPVWGAIHVNDSYRQAPQLAPFQSITFVGKPTDTGRQYEAQAIGSDADAVKTSIDQFKDIIDQMKREMSHAVEATAAAKPMADFINSIELKADGTNASATAEIKRPSP
jgi:hypothetical protein